MMLYNYKKLSCLILFCAVVVSCGRESLQDARNASGNQQDSEVKNTTSYICASDVNVRDENQNVLKDVKISFGESVTDSDITKIFNISGKSYVFKKIIITKNNQEAWIAADYISSKKCDPVDDSVNGSSPKNSYSNKVPSDSVLNIVVASGLSAMMDTIAYAEFRGAAQAYNYAAYKTIFSYGTFSDFSRHPARVLCNGLCSDASGRYQILSDVWKDINRYVNTGQVSHIPQVKNGLSDFSPKNQDRAALVLFWYKYSYDDLKNLKYGDNVKLEAITRKLAKTWASFPWSPYGQGHISWSSFKSYFWKRYKVYHNQYGY